MASFRCRQLLTAFLASILPSMVLADEPGFSLLAKGQPDQFYTGLGGPYYPLGQQPPGTVGRPKVNQAYVWSMTSAGGAVWFGTAANPVAAALGGITGVPIPIETSTNAFEFWRSQYPGVPAVLKPFLGDWRPPEIYRYTVNQGAVNVTPNDPLIQSTTGFRAAGATDEIVLLGGPDLSQIGINLFAFDAVTGEYLGSRHIGQYADIRRWVTVNGAIYTGTLHTWTLTGAGSVLRWRGTRAAPFEYEVVGEVDNEAAALCFHQGRLFAFTWSTLSQTVETVTGKRSQKPSGVWMSPAVPGSGLTAAHRLQWKKVWSADAYEPDPVIVRSLWMGACASHDGHLLWGTIQIPGYGAQVLKEVYGWPADPAEILPAIRNSFRPAALFRGKLNSAGQFQAELLYGSRVLPKYTKSGSTGTWSLAPHKMGSPKLGGAGFGDPFNMYVWSMLPHQGRLWIGTMDMSFILFGNRYTAGKAQSLMLGGDLLVLDSSSQPVKSASLTGIGNVCSFGLRDMISDGSTVLIGTATCANLLTDPHDDLVDGGWELKRFDPSQAQIQPLRSRPSLTDLDWNRVLQPLGQLPP